MDWQVAGPSNWALSGFFVLSKPFKEFQFLCLSSSLSSSSVLVKMLVFSPFDIRDPQTIIYLHLVAVVTSGLKGSH